MQTFRVTVVYPKFNKQTVYTPEQQQQQQQ